MDTTRFIQQLIEEARSLLPYTHGDVSRAVRVALQDLDAYLGTPKVTATIDALGGYEIVVALITQALTPVSALPTRADIEGQIAFEREHGPSLP